MLVSNFSSLITQLEKLGGETSVALFYVDIRHLRSINRLAGATEGDAAIAGVSEVLALWAGRGGISGRLWSNEFVAAKAIDHAQEAIDQASELRDRLAVLCYRSPVGPSPLSASIGVVIVRAGADWQQAVADAAEACEASKRRGLNQISSHTPGSRSSATRMVDSRYISDFRRLMAAGQLALHPQPIMDIRGSTPRLRKAEFLMRMEKDGVNMPLPVGTIETLEHFGLVAELDRFSSNFILDWLANNAGALEQLHSVSINLSARSLVDGAFMDRLFSDVRAAHLPHGKLCFEITETAVIEQLEVAAELIQQFRGIGAEFSLDDFGSGLCSFGYLQSLPINEVKIDGRFIRDIAQQGTAQEIVRAIHHVAKAAGKRTVAEFVDDPRKLAILQQIGVDYAQGWLFYPAVPAEKLLELLAA